VRDESDPGLPLQPTRLAEAARSAALDADVRAATRHDREARARPEQAVVADVGSSAGDLAHRRVGEKRRDHELALREVADRAEVNRLPSLVEEGR
jgi:hypothetical protein